MKLLLPDSEFKVKTYWFLGRHFMKVIVSTSDNKSYVWVMSAIAELHIRSSDAYNIAFMRMYTARAGVVIMKEI